MPGERLILGIEISCDDTAVALIRARPGAPVGTILASEVAGQDALHDPYGGVVPEIAARAHAERLDTVTAAALAAAGLALADLDAVAVTAGPGLIGGVLAGVMFAKGLAAGRGLPLWGVNHLAGHALTPRLVEPVAFPYLVLLVSGGHCQFLAVLGPERLPPPRRHHRRRPRRGLRQGGEAPRPGAARRPRRRGRGRAKATPPASPSPARSSTATAATSPSPASRPRSAAPATGWRQAQGGLTRADRADLCAGFQAAVAESLADKTAARLRRLPPPLADARPDPRRRRRRRRQRARSAPASPPRPRPRASPSSPRRSALCTDNGAMIAWAAAERMATGAPDDLTLPARPRWPLDAVAAPMLGAGRKGAKA